MCTRFRLVPMAHGIQKSVLGMRLVADNIQDSSTRFSPLNVGLGDSGDRNLIRNNTSDLLKI